LKNLKKSYDSALVAKTGITIAIAGEPNVGKSSIINALAGKKRSIVHKTPGTTRDFIDETIELQGISVNLTDTAGLIFGKIKSIDKMAVQSAKKIIGRADIILLVRDSSKKFRNLDLKKLSISRRQKLINVANKIDLKTEKNFFKSFEKLSGPCLKVSALTKKNMASIKEAAVEILKAMDLSSGSAIINPRQKRIVELAIKSISNARDNVNEKRGVELVAFDLKEALGHLGEIVGQTTDDKILNTIFSRFCIGK
jgi:tRNA modification GTPase